jgi:hypothetical protein
LSRVKNEILRLPNPRIDAVAMATKALHALMACLIVIALPLLGLAYFVLLPLVGTGVAIYFIIAEFAQLAHLVPHH